MTKNYSNWNYRVIKRNLHGEDCFCVHEVYYTEDGKPSSYSMDPVDPFGNTIEELKADLERFQAALAKPVLTEADFVK